MPRAEAPIGVFSLRLVDGSTPPRYAGTMNVAGFPYEIVAHVQTDTSGRYFAGRVLMASPMQREAKQR
jgi:hypothetical protein